MVMLSKEEKIRYSRHISLSNVGEEGQQKLKDASVLVIGAGGLGCPVLQYLTAAGVGRIGIVDDDIVDVSNLQRQILFDINNVGQRKTEAVIRKLSLQNQFVAFEPKTRRLTKDNALETINDYDIIVDGTDNFPTRYLVNDACLLLNKPLVLGSIFKFEGQLSVFNYENGPSYRCLYPEPPVHGTVPNCSEIGVIGVLPGIVGLKMANEVIKIILGIGSVLSGKLLLIDSLNNKDTLVTINRIDDNFNRTTLEESYQEVCETVEQTDEIEPSVLHRLINTGEELCLVDVREPFEHEICLIEDSLKIPLQRIPERIDELPRNRSIILICHHGSRSAMVQDFLKSRGFNNTLNLTGGIDAWSCTVDDKVPRY